MTDAAPLIELWRGDLSESVHRGHAVVMDDSGQVVQAWGDPDAVIFPRSSCKMMQALPMVEAGVELSTERLALACSSHEGAPKHVTAVREWIAEQGYTDVDFLCGHEAPRDREARHAMIRAGGTPDQAHNQCSGKHAGFLHFQRHLGAEGDYVDPDGPIQRAFRAAFEEVTGEDSPGYGIDGCAAPNFATSVTGLARAMTAYATATRGQGARQTAMASLRDAMMQHPWMVAGTGKATTTLMQAARGKAALKVGAEGVFVAILPERRMGVALKIMDGTPRAADAAMAAILIELGVLEAGDPTARGLIDAPILNRAGDPVGAIRRAAGFCD